MGVIDLSRLDQDIVSISRIIDEKIKGLCRLSDLMKGVCVDNYEKYLYRLNMELDLQS